MYVSQLVSLLIVALRYIGVTRTAGLSTQVVGIVGAGQMGSGIAQVCATR